MEVTPAETAAEAVLPQAGAKRELEVEADRASKHPKVEAAPAVEAAAGVQKALAPVVAAPGEEGAAAGGERPPTPEEVTASVRQKRLETRYLGAKFVDASAGGEGARTIGRVVYDEDDAVWIAMTTLDGGDGEEVPYYLNAASDMDGMIDAHRRRGEASGAGAGPGPGPAAGPETGASGGDECPPPVDATIEVLWEVTDNETEESRDVWWRARVVGEVPGGHVIAGDEENEDVTVAAWLIRYVARPELSEPEPTDSTVAFLSKRALLDIDSDCVMQWRREGSDDAPHDLDAEMAAEAAKIADEEGDGRPSDCVQGDIDAAVDAALATALDAMKAKYDSLPRAVQCAMADKIVQAKAHMKAALKAHLDSKPEGKTVVTPEDVQFVLRSLQAA